MGGFDVLAIANSALGAHQTWLDALGHNIANANVVRRTDEEAFREQLVDVVTAPEGGVAVRSIQQGDGEGRMVHDPDHPLADENGYVRMTSMDMNTQMTALIVAQRGYQAQVSVTQTARADYDAALQIGR
ncbi:flagellar basal-body rod protein FlgC [Nocardioidaceae bacterium]|nr:flagellar basal-body rod protein FlgC [Nocardioidaceae bacterium]